MLLNEFIEFRLGVVFDSKYNKLAVEEILNNKDRYPRIFDIINEMENDEFDSTYFDCDDPDCADSLDTLELNLAFNNAFLKENIDKDVNVESISIAKKKFDNNQFNALLTYTESLKEDVEVNVYKESTSILKRKYIYFPRSLYIYGIKRIDTIKSDFCNDNDDVLNAVNFNLRFLDNSNALENEITTSDKLNLDCSYLFEIELKVNDNLIKVHTKDLNNDLIYLLFVRPVFDKLTDEQKDLEVFKELIIKGDKNE